MLFLVNEINFNSLHLQWIGVDCFPFGSPFPLFQWHPVGLSSLNFCGDFLFFVTVGYFCGFDEFTPHLKSSKSWSKLIDRQRFWLKVQHLINQYWQIKTYHPHRPPPPLLFQVHLYFLHLRRRKMPGEMQVALPLPLPTSLLSSSTTFFSSSKLITNSASLWANSLKQHCVQMLVFNFWTHGWKIISFLI